MYTIGNFKWEKGSINDNIRRILNEKNIKYRNTLGSDIYVDLLNVGLWQKVEYTLTNPNNETYVIFVQ